MIVQQIMEMFSVFLQNYTILMLQNYSKLVSYLVCEDPEWWQHNLFKGLCKTRTRAEVPSLLAPRMFMYVFYITSHTSWVLL